MIIVILIMLVNITWEILAVSLNGSLHVNASFLNLNPKKHFCFFIFCFKQSFSSEKMSLCLKKEYFFWRKRFFRSRSVKAKIFSALKPKNKAYVIKNIFCFFTSCSKKFFFVGKNFFSSKRPFSCFNFL